MPERELGRIVRLQVQRDPLKTRGEGYDPTPILSVDEASLDARGMVGRHDGGWVLDAHHPDHPRARGGGNRALSIGFTSHYAAMAERFGQAEIGCAGENIIVDAQERISPQDLTGRVVIETDHGEVELTGAYVAAPCAEFTSFLKGADSVIPKRDQAEDVDFLDGGTRGFILDVQQVPQPMTIRVGDRVVVRS